MTLSHRSWLLVIFGAASLALQRLRLKQAPGFQTILSSLDATARRTHV